MHVASMPWWTTITLTQDDLDLAAPRTMATPANREELLTMFDTLATEARAQLASVTAEQLEQPWTLRSGETVYYTMPRGSVLRSMCFNHNVHHRGQLSVYLRLLDIPVPGMYGPSADER
jgi:uncharacterized damage-inducible protein DinB